ncbi:MAG TPA: HEAT repeat domain-containing protein [Polyangiales bacterium]|nr:HEAT repeat domain-containing protein [Polyangiales bacterium]
MSSRPLVVLALLLVSAPALGSVWPSTALRVERELSSPDAGLRRRAAEQLPDLPRAQAAKLLLSALDDTDNEVRLIAAAAARTLGVSAAGERVIPWLNDPDRRVRIAACDVLRAHPSPRAASQLGRVLSDPDAEVRMSAAEALASTGGSSAAAALLGHLDDNSAPVRRAIVGALGQLGERRAVVPLIGKIQDTEPSVRSAVARALGELGDARAMSALVLALRDNDESVRSAALEALAELSDPGATLSVAAVLERDTSPVVKIAAVQALARIGSNEALAALVRALGSSEPDIVEAAQRSLAGLGARAAPVLVECVRAGSSAEVSDRCAAVLGSVGGKGTGAVLSQALVQGVISARAGLAALGELGDPAFLPSVLERLAASDPLVRRAAVEAALQLLRTARSEGRAVEPIVRALEKARTSRAERLPLIALLGRTGSPRAVASLSPLATGSEDVELKLAALEALGALGPAGQDVILIEALDDDEPSIRRAAALALNQSASPAAAKPLLERLERGSEHDRALLVLALGGAVLRSNDAEVAERIAGLVLVSRGAERDALIEAMGRMPLPRARERLVSLLARSAFAADRSKLAETLATHAAAVPGLLALARDVDGSVRANAVWALGSSGSARELPLLRRALGDRDVAVSGNAAASLAKVALRARVSVTESLCAALSDSRSYVRANALSALALTRQRCKSARERELLRRDPSEVVRRAAAGLIQRVPAQDGADRALLARCAREEPGGEVARACAEPPRALPLGREPVTVYVVPMGESEPVAGAPFALLLADGLLRMGSADRRGAVFEAAAPAGVVSLLVPGPLAR